MLGLTDIQSPWSNSTDTHFVLPKIRTKTVQTYHIPYTSRLIFVYLYLFFLHLFIVGSILHCDSVANHVQYTFINSAMQVHNDNEFNFAKLLVFNESILHFKDHYILMTFCRCSSLYQHK